MIPEFPPNCHIHLLQCHGSLWMGSASEDESFFLQYNFVIWITKHKQWINRVRRKTCFSAGIASGSMWQSLPNERITCGVLIFLTCHYLSVDAHIEEWVDQAISIHKQNQLPRRKTYRLRELDKTKPHPIKRSSTSSSLSAGWTPLMMRTKKGMLQVRKAPVMIAITKVIL